MAKNQQQGADETWLRSDDSSSSSSSSSDSSEDSEDDGEQQQAQQDLIRARLNGRMLKAFYKRGQPPLNRANQLPPLLAANNGLGAIFGDLLGFEAAAGLGAFGAPNLGAAPDLGAFGAAGGLPFGAGPFGLGLVGAAPGFGAPAPELGGGWPFTTQANAFPSRAEGNKVALEKLFPNVDLARVPGFGSPNTSEEQLVNWMLDNMDSLPLKKGSSLTSATTTNNNKESNSQQQPNNRASNSSQSATVLPSSLPSGKNKRKRASFIHSMSDDDPDIIEIDLVEESSATALGPGTSASNSASRTSASSRSGGLPEAKKNRKRAFVEANATRQDPEIIEIDLVEEWEKKNSSSSISAPRPTSSAEKSAKLVEKGEDEKELKELAKLVEEVISLMGAELEEAEVVAVPREGWELLEHFLATKFFTLRLNSLRSIITACVGKLVPIALCAFCTESGQLGPLVELLDCYGAGNGGGGGGNGSGGVLARRNTSFYSAGDQSCEGGSGKVGKNEGLEERIYSILGVSYRGEAMAETMSMVEQEFARYETILAGLKKKYPLAWAPSSTGGEKEEKKVKIEKNAGGKKKNGGGGEENDQISRRGPWRLYPAKDSMLGLKWWGPNYFGGGRGQLSASATLMECDHCGELSAADALVSCEPSLHYSSNVVPEDPNTPSTSSSSSSMRASSSFNSSFLSASSRQQQHSYCGNCLLSWVWRKISWKWKHAASLGEMRTDSTGVACPTDGCGNRLHTKDWFGRVFARINGHHHHQQQDYSTIGGGEVRTPAVPQHSNHTRTKLAALLGSAKVDSTSQPTTTDHQPTTSQQEQVGKETAKTPTPTTSSKKAEKQQQKQSIVGDVCVVVELPDDQTMCFFLSPLSKTTVGALKENITTALKYKGGVKSWSCKKLAPRLQRLFFAGLELENNECSLEDYGVMAAANGGKKRSRKKMAVRIKLMVKYEGVLETFSLQDNYFDPAWNLDLRKVKADLAAKKRGKLPYKRPFGCMRYALRVLGRYSDGDKWLGLKGMNDEGDGEWPVAYHGTPAANVPNIILRGFDVSKSNSGPSIFCSPNHEVSLGYARTLHYVGNKGYRLVFQCRVNPQAMTVTQPGVEWTVPDGRHLRPYAVCVFPYP